MYLRRGYAIPLSSNRASLHILDEHEITCYSALVTDNLDSILLWITLLRCLRVLHALGGYKRRLVPPQSARVLYTPRLTLSCYVPRLLQFCRPDSCPALGPLTYQHRNRTPTSTSGSTLHLPARNCDDSCDWCPGRFYCVSLRIPLIN